MSVLRKLVSFVVFLMLAAVVAGTLGLYLAGRGRSVVVMQALVGRVGQVVAGQRTEQIDLRIRVRPAVQELSGTARLDVRIEAAGRRYVYFLLNEGLRVQHVWEEGADGARAELPHYQLWWVTVVELPRTLAAGETIRIGLRYSGHPRTGGSSTRSGLLERDDIVLTAHDFWYPADLQGFFRADVELTLPVQLSAVHNGREVRRLQHGDSHQVRWTAERPVAGLAMVAGRYRTWRGERGGVSYRVLLPDDVDLDGERILDNLATADRVLRTHYGESGFRRVSLFVNRGLGRPFNDGTGLIGLAPRDFRGGDYGFAATARAVAHNWWGGSVAGRWLRPGTGGEWLVEGFAEFSSWLAVREELGEAAFVQRVAMRHYDPQRAGTLSELSVVDTALEPAARAILDRKGAYVALMLQRRLGAETFDNAARRFLEGFRYQSASDADLEAVFSEVSGQDLGPFFSSWVRSDAAVDLSLDPKEGGTAVRNHGTALPPERLDLWRFPPAAEPERQTIQVDATTPVGNVERLVLDPRGQAADMYRSNNVLPRHDNPRAVARSPRGDLLVVYGEAYPWAPAIVKHLDARGQRVREWDFGRGLLAEPLWSADGTRILAVEAPRGGRPQLVALNATDGSRRRIGHDTSASGLADGTVVARESRLLRSAGGEEVVLAEHPGARVIAPLASPDSTAVAYAVRAGARMDLRIARADASGDRLLFSWHASEVTWRWSPDGSRLFAVLPGDWDWQLWELPLDGATPRALVREAARIGALAVAADGLRVAFVAEAGVAHAPQRREVFLLDSATGKVQRFNLSGGDADSVTWLDAESLLVVVADQGYQTLPPHRELRRLRLSDGSLLGFP